MVAGLLPNGTLDPRNPATRGGGRKGAGLRVPERMTGSEGRASGPGFMWRGMTMAGGWGRDWIVSRARPSSPKTLKQFGQQIRIGLIINEIIRIRIIQIPNTRGLEWPQESTDRKEAEGAGACQHGCDARGRDDRNSLVALSTWGEKKSSLSLLVRCHPRGDVDGFERNPGRGGRRGGGRTPRRPGTAGGGTHLVGFGPNPGK